MPVEAPPDRSAAASRLHWVDGVRGVCITLVVALHATSVAAAMGFVSPAVQTTDEMLATIRMPGFFLVSGLLAGGALAAPWRSFLRRRPALFAYLYVLWSLLFVAAFAVIAVPGTGTPAAAAKDYLRQLARMDGVLWYLAALAIYFLLARVTARVPVPVQLLAAGTLTVLVCLDVTATGSWGFDHAMQHYTFFLLGRYGRTVVLRVAAALNPLVTLCLAAVWGTGAGLLWGFDVQAKTAPLVLPLVGVPMLVGVVVLLNRLPVFGPALRGLGATTLPVYVLHPLALAVFGALASAADFSVDAPADVVSALAVLVLTAASVTIGVVAGRVLRRLPGVFELPPALAAWIDPGDTGIVPARRIPATVRVRPAGLELFPLVSVVVPVYRVADRIHRCAQALVAQQGVPLEVILVDDCGGDDSIERGVRILTAGGVPHRVIRHEQNRGVGAARNTGLAAATGAWVWFCDADDGAEPDFLRRMVGAALRDGTDLAICRTLRVDLADEPFAVDEPPYPCATLSGRDAARMLLDNRLRGYACNKVFRRSVLTPGLFDEGRSHEDFRPMLRLLLSTPAVALIDTPLYRYTANPVSVSGRFGRHTLDLLDVAGDVEAELSGAGVLPQWSDDYLAYRYLNVVLPLANLALRAEHAGWGDEHTETAVSTARRMTSVGDLARLARAGRPRVAATAGLLKLSPGLYSRGLAHR